MDKGRKNPIGRPNSNDIAVQFPLKIPKSIKNQYDLLDKQDKYNIRKNIVEIIKSFTYEKENCNSNLKSKSIQISKPIKITEESEDESTLKLHKLKTWHDKQLITLEEYEARKANILDSL